MTECASCHTLNPGTERACLACGTALPRSGPTGSTPLGLTSCPAGHPIDPSWRICPYCERSAATAGPPAPGRATRLDGAPPAAAGAAATRLEPVLPAGRRTVLEGASPVVPGDAFAAPPTAPPVAPSARLVAVLAAPELGGGSIFPVRAGRTTLGAGRQNDVVLAGDTEASGEHAVLLHRGDTFHLTDRLSTNGTWHNGHEVPANGTVQLQDRDCIRCGRTELIFLSIPNHPGKEE